MYGKKKDEGEMSGDAKKRRSNPFIDMKSPKANIKKYGKADSKDAKKMALMKMMRKKMK